MPRNSSGLYTLPEAAFVAGTVIRSSPVNNDFSDLATAMTQSLATTGVSEMTGPIKSANGSVTAPSITWASSLGTGFYRISDNEIGYAVNGVNKATFGDDGNFTFTAIAFANAAVAGNFLDWYEEGTFTPVLAFGGASVGITYATQTGEFTRIGNVVFFNIIVTLTSKGSSVGDATISGLPYAAGGVYTQKMTVSASIDGLDDTATTGVVTSGASTSLSLVSYNVISELSFNLDDTNFGSDSSFVITGFYRV